VNQRPFPPDPDDLDAADLEALDAIERRMLPLSSLITLASRKSPPDDWEESDQEAKPFGLGSTMVLVECEGEPPGQAEGDRE
jgi:hypothetical protein